MVIRTIFISFLVGLIGGCSTSADAAKESSSLALTCTVSTIIRDGVAQEVSDRQARSNPNFVQKVEPSDTELVITSENSKLSARFQKQVLRTPESQFLDELSGPGVIHDMYVSSGNDFVFQYYISWSEQTLTTQLTSYMYEIGHEDNGIVTMSDCFR